MSKIFFTQQEQDLLIKAIQSAELNTSGEIRVHVEPSCDKNPEDRAKEVFSLLGMHATELQNGVLIYLAYESKVFAIIGDKGIHEKVGFSFWDAERDTMKNYFSKSEYLNGLIEVIGDIGVKLKEFFPYQSNDTNELSNEISFGGEQK
ncbi:MAG: TPM domain-containing protein [Bacteroidia bacterium]